MAVERVNALNTLAARSGHSAGGERVEVNRRGAQAGLVIGGLIVTIGAVLAGRGLWLAMHGGTSYYILSGIAYVASGAQLVRRRPAGAWLVLALFAASVARALWEVGLNYWLWEVGPNYWALFPRVLLPAGLAFLALLATLRFPANKSWRAAAHTAGVLGLLIGVQFAFAFVSHGGVHSLLPPSLVSTGQSDEPSDSYSDGRTNAGSR
jgi:quinate dehydrogenase (quinone)